MAAFSKKLLADLPVVGILRGFSEDESARLVETSVNAGLTNVEITMNTPGAAKQIRRAGRLVGQRMNIGAGTVTSGALLEEALEAGANFIVTPHLDAALVGRCVNAKIPVFPGAFTPTEIARAWDLGATKVKVFPSAWLGKDYLRRISEILPDIELMPTGGVTVESLPEFVEAGASGFGIGSPLFAAERVKMGDYSWVSDQCRRFKQAWENAG